MSHKKAGGSTALGRDSQAKKLGIKLFDGEKVRPGMILVRQRGTQVHPGSNVKKGGDDTLLATALGMVKFYSRKVRGYNGKMKLRKFVSIVPQEK
jgi:large subunit ribosomal protein L27